jgi:hypothetical protein
VVEGGEGADGVAAQRLLVEGARVVGNAAA